MKHRVRIQPTPARVLILLLLVLNLGSAMWWWLRPEPAPPPGPQPERGAARLQLASEMSTTALAAARTTNAGADTNAALAEADSDQDSNAGPKRCYRFGPFANAQAAAAWARMPAGAQRIGTRNEPAPGRGGSWDVSLPPQANLAAAQALAQRIQAAGFRDYYIIAEGAAANGIALGRFGNEAMAQRHQAALQAAGFQAQIQGPENTRRYWLEVEAGGDFNAGAARVRTSAERMLPQDCAPG